MAAVEVFPFKENVGVSATIEYRTRASQFGDGYEQLGGDGINSEQEKSTHEFVMRKPEAKLMQAFLARHAGYKAFEYTTPLGEVLLMTCDKSSYTARTRDLFVFTLTFKQAHHA